MQPPEGERAPARGHGIVLCSMGFMVKDEQPIIWRGPMLDKAIRQFLTDVDWGNLDYLIVDLPPGTGDIHLTIVQTVPLTGVLVVTTPQLVALADAK